MLWKIVILLNKKAIFFWALLVKIYTKKQHGVCSDDDLLRANKEQLFLRLLGYSVLLSGLHAQSGRDGKSPKWGDRLQFSSSKVTNYDKCFTLFVCWTVGVHTLVSSPLPPYLGQLRLWVWPVTREPLRTGGEGKKNTRGQTTTKRSASN